MRPELWFLLHSLNPYIYHNIYMIFFLCQIGKLKHMRKKFVTHENKNQCKFWDNISIYVRFIYSKLNIWTCFKFIIPLWLIILISTKLTDVSKFVCKYLSANRFSPPKTNNNISPKIILLIGKTFMFMMYFMIKIILSSFETLKLIWGMVLTTQ